MRQSPILKTIWQIIIDTFLIGKYPWKPTSMSAYRILSGTAMPIYIL